MVVNHLRLQNPWWRDSSLIELDDHVRVFRESKCRWKPTLDIDPDRDIIYSLRGPRQIGKTTYIKVFIRDLIRRNIDPRNIIYLYGEVFANWKELLEALQFYFKNIGVGRAYVFIDEISAVENWPRAIKYLYDIGLLRNNFVLLCGSHAMDILRGVELLPGRRGEYLETPDYVLMPMNFYEYTRTIMPELLEEIEMDVNFGSMEAALESLYSFHTELRGLLERYLRGGGFPHIQDYMVRYGTANKRFYEDFIAYVKGDAHKEKISIIAMLQAVRRIIETLSSTISWRGLAHGTDYNYETIQRTVEFLRAAFTIEILYQPKISRKTIMPDFKKDKKIYPLDPFILYAFDIWITGAQSVLDIIDGWLKDRTLRGKLIEGVILRHLIEFVTGKRFSEEPLTKIFYAKKNDREMDFIALGKTTLLIESKLKKKSKIYIPQNITQPNKTYIIMSTEDEYEKQRNILITPLPELLLYLSYPNKNQH